MPADIYEIIALGARWWFLLLGALIVLRAFGWLRRDGKRTRRRLRQLPDAGMIGEMVVVCGSDELEEGWVIPIPREGTLGCFRSCDVVVPVEGVAPQHCDFIFVNGKGLLVYPRRRCFVAVDGEEYTGLRRAGKHPMAHGSRLQIGDAVLRLRLFAGLEAEAAAHVREEWHLNTQNEYEQTQEAWQQTTNVYHQEPMAWEDIPQGNGGAYRQMQGMPGWPQPQPAQPWQQSVQGQPYQQPYPYLQMQQPAWQPQQPVMQGYPPQMENRDAAAETEPVTEHRRRRRRRRSDEEA